MLSSSRKASGIVPAHIASRYRARHSFDPDTGYKTLRAARTKLRSLWLLAGTSIVISLVMALSMAAFVMKAGNQVSMWQIWLFMFLIPSLFAGLGVFMVVTGVRPTETEMRQAESSVRKFEKRYRDFLLSLGLDAGEAASLDDDKTLALCNRLVGSYSAAIAAPGTDSVERLRLEAKLAGAKERFSDMGYPLDEKA